MDSDQLLVTPYWRTVLSITERVSVERPMHATFFAGNLQAKSEEPII